MLEVRNNSDCALKSGKSAIWEVAQFVSKHFGVLDQNKGIFFHPMVEIANAHFEFKNCNVYK